MYVSKLYRVVSRAKPPCCPPRSDPRGGRGGGPWGGRERGGVGVVGGGVRGGVPWGQKLSEKWNILCKTIKMVKT